MARLFWLPCFYQERLTSCANLICFYQQKNAALGTVLECHLQKIIDLQVHLMTPSMFTLWETEIG